MPASLVQFAILWCAALAAWLLGGTLAPGDGEAGARLGLLPPIWQLAAALVLATAAGWALRPTPSRVLPLVLMAVLVAPWLPFPIPAVFLALTGPAAVVAAVAIVMAWLAGTVPGPRRMPVWLVDPGRAVVAAAVAAGVLFGAAAWRAAPMVPGGDEPHYLVMTQSLLYDGDLRVENNYLRGDYRQFVNMELRPHYLRRGIDGEIYSVHLPGLPALVLPAFAAGGHRGVMVFLIVLAACGAALAWRLAWEITGSAGAAWFGWASVVLSAPVVFHAFSVYPDGPAGALLLVGFWALLRAASPRETSSRAGAWILAGTALALLPWLHSRLAVLSALLGAFVLWHLVRRPDAVRNAAAFLAVPAAAAAGWFAYFYVIYGELNPTAPYGAVNITSPAYMPSGIGGLFFDHQFGLLPNAPIYLVCLIGLGVMLGARRRYRLDRPLAIWLAAAVAATAATYVLAISPMRMWWGGSSAPARFLVPLLPALAIPAAVAWQSARHRTTRAAMLCALGASAGITALLVWVQRGRLAFNVRDSYGLLADWLSPLVVLAEGLPSFHRQPEHHGFYHAAIWLALLLAAWVVARRLETAGRLRTRGAVATAILLALIAAGMTAVTAVWAVTGSNRLQTASAQVELLRRIEPGSRHLALTYEPFRRVAPDDLAGRLRLRSSERWRTGGVPPLLAVAGPLPAGTYTLEMKTSPGDEGHVAVGIGREWFPLREFGLAAGGAGTRDLSLEFPVDIRAILLHGDAAAIDRIADVAVRPVSVLPRRLRPSSAYARQAVRYPGGDVYFLNDGVFAETPAFWVRGGWTADMVIVPEHGGGTVRLTLHNAPVENQVTLRSAGWTLDVGLQPGEAREVVVPLRPPPGPPATLSIGSAAGYRPAQVDPESRDQRWLGVRVALP